VEKRKELKSKNGTLYFSTHQHSHSFSIPLTCTHSLILSSTHKHTPHKNQKKIKIKHLASLIMHGLPQSFFSLQKPKFSSSLSGGNHSRTRGKTHKKFDAIQALQDPLEVPVGLVTRIRAKRFKEAFNELLQDTWAKVDFKRILNNEE
jgi:hypothetical protein